MTLRAKKLKPGVSHRRPKPLHVHSGKLHFQFIELLIRIEHNATLNKLTLLYGIKLKSQKLTLNEADKNQKIQIEVNG